MANFPTIFDLLARFDFLRGLPAAYLLFVTTFVIIVARHWQISVFMLAAQYLIAGLLFVDMLDPRLAVIKVLVGQFVCLILYVTARQVAWGQLPVDVSLEEAVQLRRQLQLRFGQFLLPSTTLFRIFLALLTVVVVYTLSQRAIFRLPAVTDPVNLAVFILLCMGLLGLSLSTEPLRAGLGVLTFWLGFELFFASLEQSVALLAVLAAATLIAALAIAYLIQARHAIPAIFAERRRRS
ncbi:MAG: hypothetical protein KDE59_28070 [Anaerolineales bacterium]|nr:hypothetical protein [Anaerolineales bacterium]